jgi:hypothetical protein
MPRVRTVGIAPPILRKRFLNIHLRIERILLDELSARFDDVAHQFGEHVVGVFHMVDADLQQGAGP